MNFEQLELPSGLQLRVQQDADAASLFAIIQAENTRLNQFLGWPPSVRSEQDALRTIRRNRQEFAAGEAAVYVIHFQQVLVGIVGLNTISGSVGEVGYWLTRAGEGRGLMSHAVSALMDWYLNVGRLDTFMVRCAVDNLPSNRLALRLGYHFYRCEPRAEIVRDAWVDHNVYHWRQGRNARVLLPELSA